MPLSPQMQQLQHQVSQAAASLDRVLEEVSKVIVGQRDMLEKLLVGLLSQGHLLLEGVPGLAKTLTLQTFSSSLALAFQRIQFTPDLLPADLLGTLIYDQAKGEFTPKFGPLFSNVILADEINRAPAKVQSALLEAMQEKQITLGETTYRLPEPFLVMATQNPIEQEGTYPLPEAQVDRFMLKILVNYPSPQEELTIMDRMIEQNPVQVQAVLSPDMLQQIQGLVRQIYMSPEIKEYIIRIIFATRDPDKFGLTIQKGRKERSLKYYIEHGASPRASLALNLASRAHALIKHRSYVIADDIKSVVHEILRHRVIASYEADADEVNSDDIIDKILGKIEVP